MARSTKIYVVSSPNWGVMAAFTVKHECATWWEQFGNQYLTVRSFDDNPRGKRMDPGVVMNTVTWKPVK